MNQAEYITDLKNTLFKINRQSWTELKMLENRTGMTASNASQEEQETLDKAKQALSLITEILEKI